MEAKLIAPVSRRSGEDANSVGYPIGVAADKGPQRWLNADAYAGHLFAGIQAVVVLDGTGSTHEAAEFATNAAWAAARVAARKDHGYAILHAAELNANPDTGPDTDLPDPDGAIVVATVHPTAGWSIASAGDCTTFSFADGHARRVTPAHTVGELLRDLGLPDDIAAGRDHQLNHSLGRAQIGKVPSAGSRRPLWSWGPTV